MNETLINETFTRPKEQPQQLPSVFIIILSQASIAVLVNVTFSIVCFKSLRNNFHNVLVLSLCMTDSVVGVCFIWSLSLRLIMTTITSWSCLFTLLPLVFSYFASYCLVLLLCLERYLVVKSYNFGAKEKLNNIKFKLIGGVFSASFLLALVLFFIPKNVTVMACTAQNLYGKYYMHYVFIVSGTMSILLLIIIILALLTAYRVWENFLQSKKKIFPKNSHVSFRNNVFENNDDVTGPSNHIAGPSYLHCRHQQQLDITVDCNEIILPDNKRREQKISVFLTKGVLPLKSVAEGERRPRENIADNVSLKGSKTSVEGTNSNSNSNSINRDSNKNSSAAKFSWEVRAFITCVLIAISTLVFTGPVVACFWIDLVSNSLIQLQTRAFIFALSTTNSIINPFIYAWRISEIRMSFKSLFRHN